MIAEVLGQTCIDGGVCHHQCQSKCFRRECCSPFSDYEGPWKYSKTAIEKALPRWSGIAYSGTDAHANFYASLCDIFVCTGWQDPDLICMEYLEMVKAELRPLLDNKPTGKQIEELRQWEIQMKPLRALCVFVHNERITLLIESRK